jgi:hypothetical protein
MVEPGFVVTCDDVQPHHAIVLAANDKRLVLYLPEGDRCTSLERGLFESRDEMFARRMVKSEIARLTTEKAAQIADQARQVYLHE